MGFQIVRKRGFKEVTIEDEGLSIEEEITELEKRIDVLAEEKRLQKAKINRYDKMLENILIMIDTRNKKIGCAACVKTQKQINLIRDWIMNLK